MSRERNGRMAGSCAGRSEALSDEELGRVQGGAAAAQNLTEHGGTAMVEAYFNPTEISVDKSVPWGRKK